MAVITEIPEIIENNNQNIVSQVYELSKTPYPALVGSVTYLYQGLLANPQPLKEIQTNHNKFLSFKREVNISGVSNLKKTFIMASPSRKNNTLFGAMLGLASFMILDSDLESGSGLAAVWSGLYVLVNRKYLYNGLRYMKFQPVFAHSLAIVNTLIYGKRYLIDVKKF